MGKSREQMLVDADAQSGTVIFLEDLAENLPEEITVDDVKAHPWLVQLIAVVARIEGMSTYAAYVYAKEQAGAPQSEKRGYLLALPEGQRKMVARAVMFDARMEYEGGTRADLAWKALHSANNVLAQLCARQIPLPPLDGITDRSLSDALIGFDWRP